jgi:hypothetical protein
MLAERQGVTENEGDGRSYSVVDRTVLEGRGSDGNTMPTDNANNSLQTEILLHQHTIKNEGKTAIH